MKVVKTVMVLVLLFSCSNSTESKSETHSDVLNFLSSDGFNTASALFEDGQVVIEEDIAFNIQDIKQRISDQKVTRDKQWRTQYQISSSRVQDIKVRFDRKLSSDWVASGRAAIQQLNNVANSSIYLREVTSGEDIYVKHSRKTRSARGEFPSSDGRAGYSIIINPKLSPTGYYANTMLHELGHNIGLRHDHAPDEGIDPSQQIPGTPYSDTYSVMSYNSNRYFTNYDKIAIATLYPN